MQGSLDLYELRHLAADTYAKAFGAADGPALPLLPAAEWAENGPQWAAFCSALGADPAHGLAFEQFKLL